MRRFFSRSGSSLVCVCIFTGVAVFCVGSVLVLIGSSSRLIIDTHNLNKAFYLADAGIAAALSELNSGGDGVFPDRISSRAMFADTSGFWGDWGFTTTVTNLSGNSDELTIISNGRHGHVQTVRSDVRRVSSEAIHTLYSHAIYAGNSSGDPNYDLRVGGTGNGSDWVAGDVYCNGDISVSGAAILSNPEAFVDENGNGYPDQGEPFTDVHAIFAHGDWPTVFMSALSQEDFDAYTADGDFSRCSINGRYDFGEAFVDTIGNGVYDYTEPYEDLDGDGLYSFGDSFTDLNDDGAWDEGDEFVDRGNGQYDSGEEYHDINGNGVWDDETQGTPGHWEGSGWSRRWIEGTAAPAEPYEDVGNGVYDEGESFVDGNGVYDEGEPFHDDRNGVYEYGTEATSQISGMPSPAPGQTDATGYNDYIDPPELDRMYYELAKGSIPPSDALSRWGYDIAVADANYSLQGKISDQNNPCHIFVKNPDNRQYEKIGDKDDFFLEDPTDPSYGDASQYITINENGNDKVYYVDGNLYVHNPDTYDFMFRNEGTLITIVANGNITISDEIWYNGGTENPVDGLCLIAKKDPDEPDSGNIYLGDAQFGTGGDIHSFLYAENNFVDNNLDTSGQPYLSVFGNMSAGNQVMINRDGPARTRLDVTLNESLRDRIIVPPGLPPPTGSQRGIELETQWGIVPGSWGSFSRLLAVPSE